MSAPGLSAFERLGQINRELADWLGHGPAILSGGPDVRHEDEIVVCGLLGGKDVGKSTLINAIAQEPISVPDAEVGPGTSRPLAYVHADTVEALQRRFASLPDRSRAMEYDVRVHHTSPLQSLVLVDLPDIDSTFAAHLETVRSVLGCLDRVVWVFDPKKGDDRAVAELARRVIRDECCAYAVLNKLDETLRDGLDPHGTADFWQRRCTWFAECVQSIGLRLADSQRFMLSARFPAAEAFECAVGQSWGDAAWSRFQHDRQPVTDLAQFGAAEFSRFRGEMLRPLSTDEIHRLKRSNRTAELRADLDAVWRHHDLAGALQHAKDTLDVLDREYARQFDTAMQTTVARRLAHVGRPDVELAQTLMAGRVECWPILPVLYWPLRGLVRWIATRGSSPPSRGPDPTPEDRFRAQGRSLEHRIDAWQTRMRLWLAMAPVTAGVERAWPSPAQQARAAAAAAWERAEDLDDQVLATCRAADARPGVLGRWLLWFILFWFPLVQPLTRAVLQFASEQNPTSVLQAATTVVMALGAGSLAKGILAAGLVYVIILAVMFARAVRGVRRERRESVMDTYPPTLYAETVREALSEEVVAPCRRPLEAFARRLEQVQQELDELRPGA